MKKYDSKKADSFLQTDQYNLAGLLAKAKNLSAMNEQVHACLEPEMADYCQVANVHGDKLILLVANGSIATQIRFQGMDLVRKFKTHPLLQHINRVECKVRPTTTQPHLPQDDDGKPRQMAPLSAPTAAFMRDIAETLDNDHLREAMLKITEHVEK